MSWERIQLVLRFAGELPPLGLLRDGGGERMEPTRQWVAGGDTLVRFNVLQGPGQVPLALGAWTLVDKAGLPVHIDPRDGAADGLAAAERRLALSLARTYTVRVHWDPETAFLTLRTAIDPPRVGQDDPDPLEGTDDAGRAESGQASRSLASRVLRRLQWKRIRRKVWRSAFALTRRIVRRGPPVVLFATRLSPRLTGNLEVVHSRMRERGLDREFRLVTIAKPSISERLPWRDTLRLLRSMASADVIFLDDSFYPVYWVEFPPDVRIVQLWHASGAFKTVGYSRSATAGNPPFNPYGRVHKNTTHVIVSSEFDAPFYAEALGVPESRLYPTGIPRMDRYFDPVARDGAIAQARTLFPQIEGHAVWLFAPTYRGQRVASASYDLDRIDVAALYELAVEKDAVVIFKLHPFVRERLAIPAAYRDRLLEASDAPMDVNDLLFSVDLLITDYSSIVFEYSVLGRPMLFFAYDLEEYVAERDFYVDFEAFVPGRIVRTFAELLDAIRTGDFAAELVDEFARKHFAHLDGGSTDRVIELAIGR